MRNLGATFVTNLKSTISQRAVPFMRSSCPSYAQGWENRTYNHPVLSLDGRKGLLDVRLSEGFCTVPVGWSFKTPGRGLSLPVCLKF